MKRTCLLATLVVTLGLLPLAANATNVALGAAVSPNGTFFTDSGWGGDVISPASRIVNGVFAPQGTQWNTDGVWWNGYDNPGNNIVINLNGTYSITSFIVQADDNDTYQVSYFDATTNGWKTAYDVPYQFSFGLVTRPEYTLATPIATSKLMFTATAGDDHYSVSQIVANGSAVPIPGAVLLFAPGLAGLAAIRRRFKK